MVTNFDSTTLQVGTVGLLQSQGCLIIPLVWVGPGHKEAAVEEAAARAASI